MAEVTSRFSTLSTKTADFDTMIKRFGVVTVMNADVYDCVYTGRNDSNVTDLKDVLGIITEIKKKKTPLCTLDTLKIANISVEGPDKTVTGGQYSNPLIKFGKTARLEMQDALGNARALAELGGGILEGKEVGLTSELKFHMGENFVGPKTIVGDSFFIDQKTGAQVPVKLIIYQMLPDSIFNLTQDAEGDATVFDLNGDLLATPVLVGLDGEAPAATVGLFYSIVSADEYDKAPSA